jgi:excisionase family DNA binding protein
MADEYLTIDEVAAKVKVKPKTVREWLRTKRLKGVKAGHFWRIRPEDLEAFLEGKPTDEDLDDIAAAEAALAEGRPRPYEEVRRELGLS